MKSGYDVHSAMTFLLVGLGIGSVLATVFKPKQKSPARGRRKRKSFAGPWRKTLRDRFLM